MVQGLLGSFSGLLGPTDSCNVRREECWQPPTTSFSLGADGPYCVQLREYRDDPTRGGW